MVVEPTNQEQIDMMQAMVDAESQSAEESVKE